MRQYTIQTFALLAGLAGVCGAAHAQTNSSPITSTADAFVDSAQPNNNYGGAGAVGIAAPGSPKGEFQSYIQFPTTAAKATFDSAYGVGNWTVTGISLTLNSAAPNNPLFNGQGAGPGGTNVNTAGKFKVLWMGDDNWIEGPGTPASAAFAPNITFNNLPSSASNQTLATALQFGGGTSGTTPYLLSTSAGVQADVAGGSVLGLQLLADDTVIQYLFNSRTGPGAAPSIVISAVPEPATATVVVLALGSFFVNRRARRNA